MLSKLNPQASLKLSVIILASLVFSVGQVMVNQSEANIGSVSWCVTDGDTPRVISTGQKTLRMQDVEISRNTTSLIKTIPLSQGFSFSLADGSDSAKNEFGDGFGLTGNVDEQQTFSWDWFVVDQGKHAKKLQESGELAFSTAQTVNGTEINRIEFLTDVSLRIYRMSDGMESPPRWRIKISKGSVISWPLAGPGLT